MSGLAPQQDARKRKFVWPPTRAVEVAARGVRATGDAGELKRALPTGDPLASRVWEAEAPIPSWRSALREIERVWMGLASPPLAERMAETGWMADEAHDYCGRCGRTVGAHEADGSGCSRCRGRALAWERLVRLGEYRGLLRDVVHEVKFTRWRNVGDQIGRMLGRELASRLDASGIRREEAAIVPVPTSWLRRMHRGIDHALVIARGVAAESGAELRPALARSHRPSQTSVPSSQRLANVKGSIRSRDGVGLDGRVLIVVDDVTTTRATLAAACAALSRASRAGGVGGGEAVGTPARIWAAVVAVTPEPGQRDLRGRGDNGGAG